MDISTLNLPQAILDDNAEFIVEMQLDDNKLMKDNRFFSDYVLSIETYVTKFGLHFYVDNDSETIYFYGLDNNNDHNNMISVIFKIYKAEWIKNYLSVYKWYSLYDIQHGDEVEDMLEIFTRRGV